MSNPPATYLFDVAKAPTAKTTAPAQSQDCTPAQILKSSNFYIMWIVHFIGAGAGLMVIGSVAGTAKQSMGELAFLAVVILAVGNAAGRIIAGSLSDRIGRTLTLSLMLGFQAVLMFIAIPIMGAEHPSALLLLVVTTLIGFNYITNLALFPAMPRICEA